MGTSEFQWHHDQVTKGRIGFCSRSCGNGKLKMMGVARGGGAQDHAFSNASMHFGAQHVENAVLQVVKICDVTDPDELYSVLVDFVHHIFFR